MTRFLTVGMLAASAILFLMPLASAQTPPPVAQTPDQPDAERTKQDLSTLLDHYPPTLRGVLALDPGLLSNPAYLAPYPALASYLNAHPEVVRNPVFYIGDGSNPHFGQDAVTDLWGKVLDGFSIFAGFGLAIGLLVWLIRTLIDYRRWSRLAKVQTDVHTKLLDRFTAQEDLLAYIQSPAGSRFCSRRPSLWTPLPAAWAPLWDAFCGPCRAAWC